MRTYFKGTQVYISGDMKFNLGTEIDHNTMVSRVKDVFPKAVFVSYDSTLNVIYFEYLSSERVTGYRLLPMKGSYVDVRGMNPKPVDGDSIYIGDTEYHYYKDDKDGAIVLFPMGAL